MPISKGWMMRNAKGDENTKDKQVTNAKNETTKTMGDGSHGREFFLSQQTQLAWHHNPLNHGLMNHHSGQQYKRDERLISKDKAIFTARPSFTTRPPSR